MVHAALTSGSARSLPTSRRPRAPASARIELAPGPCRGGAWPAVSVLSLSTPVRRGCERVRRRHPAESGLFDACYYYGRTASPAAIIEGSADLFRRAGEVRHEDFQSLMLYAQSAAHALDATGRPRKRCPGRHSPPPERARTSIRSTAAALSLGAELALFSRRPDLKSAQRNPGRHARSRLYPDDSGTLLNAACLCVSSSATGRSPRTAGADNSSLPARLGQARLDRSRSRSYGILTRRPAVQRRSPPGSHSLVSRFGFRGLPLRRHSSSEAQIFTPASRLASCGRRDGLISRRAGRSRFLQRHGRCRRRTPAFAVAGTSVARRAPGTRPPPRRRRPGR